MSASGREPGLPRAVEDLDVPAIVQDSFARPRDCEVFWADQARLIENFALRAQLDGTRRADIDQSARISVAQTSNEAANTAIRFDECKALGYRLPSYGGAAVMRVSVPKEVRRPGPDSVARGLIDVKGCGVAGGSLPAG